MPRTSQILETVDITLFGKGIEIQEIGVNYDTFDRAFAPFAGNQKFSISNRHHPNALISIIRSIHFSG
jgi:hypothetical protein